ncbi:MAG: DUF1343 domain-containing protein [Salinivirgaceae bacterium]|nr:MAG: DUF1343 domain-containing protein [Salinivirgaceae bacterium]
MHKNSLILYITFLFLQIFTANAQNIITGAERTELYFESLKEKRIGIVTNHTGLIEYTHIVDSMLGAGLEVTYIFSPEHGFRGNSDAGHLIHNSVDDETGLEIVSLYGKNKKQDAKYLKKLDVVVFDIQDVGVRFYTYISTLHYVMEACAENNVPLIVLDRPNPNGHFVDGPVLDPQFKSFVGLDPIPLVHGLTMGELAKMINGENWINGTCELTVIPCENYTHKDLYDLPVPPSPNLPNMQAVYLYPSLGFFEGTIMSVGRGTNLPFQVYGHPNYIDKDFSFLPLPTYGATNPKLKGETCYGPKPEDILYEHAINSGINIGFLKDAYLKTQTDKFFNNFFNLLAGNATLQEQIIKDVPVEDIKQSWQPGLERYLKMRKKYLLYDDFD